MSNLKTVVTKSQCITKYAHTKNIGEINAEFDRFTVYVEGEEHFASIHFTEARDYFIEACETHTDAVINLYGELTTLSRYN